MSIQLVPGRGIPRDFVQLLKLAQELAPKSYNPYSGFQVGAAVETDAGSQFGSACVENASFGLTICAEPGAIMAANAAGFRDIAKLAVVGGDPIAATRVACMPCGRCREIIWEFATQNKRDIQIICSNLDMSNVVLTTARELLPLPWGRDF